MSILGGFAMGAGSAIAGKLFGSKSNPMQDFQNLYYDNLWGAVAPGLAADIKRLKKIFKTQILPQYKKNLAAAKAFGKKGKIDIEKNRKRNLAMADQAMIDSGRGNTSVRDSLRAGLNDDATRAQTGLDERVAGMTNQLRMGLAGAHQQYITDYQNLRNFRHSAVLGSAQGSVFPGAAGLYGQQNQAQGAFGQGMGQSFQQIIQGLFSGGQYANPPSYWNQQQESGTA